MPMTGGGRSSRVCECSLPKEKLAERCPRCVALDTERRIGRSGMNDVIAFLRGCGVAMTHEDVADATGLSIATAREYVQKLVREGRVARRMTRDRASDFGNTLGAYTWIAEEEHAVA